MRPPPLARRSPARFRWPIRLWWLARLLAGLLVVGRLARAAHRRPALTVASSTTEDASATISVVIPARDEEARLPPLLRALAGDPAVGEVIVVDDESTDGTAAMATAAGARVVAGSPPPAGWVGKPWALEQGVSAAGGTWIVTMDADVEPAHGLPAALVGRAVADGLDLATLAGRFSCPTKGLRLLHPALLTTLVYRFGPPGAGGRPARPRRLLANGQCTAFRREALVAAGGFAVAAPHLTDDIALARGLAARGWRVALLDGTASLRVRMHDDAADAWRSWGRSLPMPDVTTVPWKVLDGLTLLLTLALPLPRLLLRRADPLDLALLALRAGTLAGTARAYEERGMAYWLSPLADPAAVARVAWGAIRPGRTWRGRTYPAPG